jgi:hypothetical protein
VNYSDFIKDKTVAIVGPAKYMENLSLGEEIDDHDLVVRINRSIETIDTYHDNIGSMADILYTCLIETAQNAGRLNVDELVGKYKVKYVCVPPVSDMKGVSTQTQIHPMANPKTVKSIKKNIPFRVVDHEFHTSLAENVDCRPNTGFLAIYDLLRFQPKRLSIYGFSFYLDGFISGCKDGIEKEKGVTAEEFGHMAFVSKRHVQKNMWEYAKKTLIDNPRVRLDRVLEKILRLDNLSKDEFYEKT